MPELYFKAEIPIDAVKRLVEYVPEDPFGVVSVDAAIKIVGNGNAYREGGFGTAYVNEDLPESFDDLCQQIEAYLPDDEKDGMPGYGANPMLLALIQKLAKKILIEALQHLM